MVKIKIIKLFLKGQIMSRKSKEEALIEFYSQCPVIEVKPVEAEVVYPAAIEGLIELRGGDNASGSSLQDAFLRPRDAGTCIDTVCFE